MDSISYNIDKVVAIDYVRSGDVDKGIEYSEVYNKSIDEKIEEAKDDEDLKVQLEAEKSNFNKVFGEALFDHVRESFNSHKWGQTLRYAKVLLKYGMQDPQLFKYLSFCCRELNQSDTRFFFANKYAEVPEAQKYDKELGKFLAEAYLNHADYEEQLSKITHKYPLPQLVVRKDFLLDHLYKYVDAFPDDPDGWHLLGHIYASANYDQIGVLEESLKYYEKAYSLAQNELLYMKNLALAYSRARHKEQAEEIYRRILAAFRDPFTPDDHFNYAAFRIKNGDYINGFIHYERRMDKRDNVEFTSTLNKPRWNGYSDLSDSTLLVLLEQGFGDVVMFIRFVKEMMPRCKKVIAVVQDELYNLFCESNLGFDIYSIRKTDLSKLEYDCHIALISLPRVLKTVPETVPYREGYLDLDPQRVSDYRDSYILDTPKVKIGICFEGAGYARKQARDIDWKYIKDIAQIGDVELYCFNIDKDEQFFKNIDENIEVICLGHTFKNFAATAAGIKNMDFMISTDNVILNLCGALGKKTFAPLNFDYEYRWYNAESGKVVWYDSVSSYVNERQNDWEPTMQRLLADAKAYYETIKR